MAFPPYIEPDFFTLNQICQRWSDWGCTVDDLIQLCRSDKIEIGVNLSRTKTMFGSLISGYFAISPHDIKRDHNDIYVETNTIYENSEEEEKQEPIFYLLSKNQQWSSGDLVITKIERDRIEGKSKPKKTTDDLPEKQVNDSINPREKNGMTAVIETLCFMANLDLTHRSKAAGIIKMVSDEQGTNAPSQQTINKYLNNITDKKV